MSSGENGSSSVFLKQLLNSLIDLVFNDMIVLKKALMNPAIFTVIFNFLEVEILNPISCIGWSSERHYNLIFHPLITYISWSNCYHVSYMCYFSEICKVLASLTIPFLKTFLPTIGKTSIVSILLWISRNISISIFNGESCSWDQENCNKENAARIFNHE